MVGIPNWRHSCLISLWVLPTRLSCSGKERGERGEGRGKRGEGRKEVEAA